MLLVAVALLMGANTVKAEEIELWSGTATSQQTVAAKEQFAGVTAGDKIRVYVTPDPVYWSLSFKNGYWGAVVLANSNSNGEIKYAEGGTITDGYIEGELTDASLETLTAEGSGGLLLVYEKLTYSRITLVNANGVETELWSGTPSGQKVVEPEQFADAVAGDKIRVYVTVDPVEWSLSFKNGGYGTVVLANSDSNGEIKYANGGTITDGYIEGELNDASVATLNDQYSGGLLLVPSKLTMTRVVLVSNGVTPTPTKTEVTLAYSSATASATTAAIGQTLANAPTLSVTPYDLTGITYSSSEEGVATVAEDGTVTIVGAGTTTITATFAETETHMGASASYTLTVTAVTVPTPSGEILWEGYFDTGSWQRLYITENIFADINEGDTLGVFGMNTNDSWQFEIYDGNGQQRVYMNTLNQVILVTADMANNLKTAVDGNYASFFGQSFIVTAITLKAKTDSPVITPADITLTFASATAEATVGETFTAPTLTAKAGEETINGLTYSYSSSNTSVATVDNNGAVTIIAVGTTTITATFAGNDSYNGASASYTLTVSEAVVEPEPVETVTANISTARYATFCSEKNLDFTNVSGLKAYIAKSVSEGNVMLEQVMGTVKAGTGLVIKGETADIPVTEAEGTEYSDNLLVGVLESTLVYDPSSYVLTEVNRQVVFAQTIFNAATVTPGHAYLKLPDSEARLRNLIICDNETLGISDNNRETITNSCYYDLQGHRVNSSKAKGQRSKIMIVNGKKVLNK